MANAWELGVARGRLTSTASNNRSQVTSSECFAASDSHGLPLHSPVSRCRCMASTSRVPGTHAQHSTPIARAVRQVMRQKARWRTYRMLNASVVIIPKTPFWVRCHPLPWPPYKQARGKRIASIPRARQPGTLRTAAKIRKAAGARLPARGQLRHTCSRPALDLPAAMRLVRGNPRNP